MGPSLFLALLAFVSVVGGEEKAAAEANWYTKWYNSDTVYIDGDGNTQRSGGAALSDEGSGRGLGASDLEPVGPELGSGHWTPSSALPGPSVDDEDAPVLGSGDFARPSTPRVPVPVTFTDDEDLSQASGDENWVSPVWPEPATRPPPPPDPTTTERSWWQPERPSTPKPWEPPTQPPVLVEERETTPPPVPEPRTTAAPAPDAGDSTPNPGIYEQPKASPFDPFLKPGILAAVIGGAVVGLLAAILLVMFIIYRMRKKDEGSYALEEPKSLPPAHYPYAYQKAPTKEFYA